MVILEKAIVIPSYEFPDWIANNSNLTVIKAVFDGENICIICKPKGDNETQ